MGIICININVDISGYVDIGSNIVIGMIIIKELYEFKVL